MRQIGFWLPVILFISANPIGAAAENSSFANFAEVFTREVLALSPVGATSAGYHRHTDARTGRTLELDELLDDYSASGLRHERDVLQRLEKALSRFAPGSLSPEEQIDYRIMRDALEGLRFELDRIQAYRHNPDSYADTLGYAIFNPLVEEYAPPNVRLGHLFARLEKVPKFLAEARQNLVDTDPVYTRAASNGIEGDIGLLKGLLRQLVDQTGDAHLRERYEQLIPQTVAALDAFRHYLTEDLAKHSTGTWRLGPALYREKLRLALGTDLTPEELLRRAEQRMAEIRRDMLATAEPLHRQFFPDHGEHNELAPRERENRIIREVLDQIATEHPDRNALLEEARKDLASLRNFIQEKSILTLPAGQNLQVIETPLFLRDSYGVGGLAPAPPLEPRLGAFFWVTPIPADWPAARVESKLREYNHYTLQILAMHEALPGHYVQFEDANRLKPESRRVLRAVFSNGPYVEGWAMYSETLVLDHGYMDFSPKLKLMHQKWQLRAVTNAALDFRMHTRNMSDAEALDLLENGAFQEAAEAEAKLIRAKLSSAQLPTYFVGLDGWQGIRAAVAQAEGSAFNEQEFHDRALSVGPIPLPELKKLLLSSVHPEEKRQASD